MMAKRRRKDCPYNTFGFSSFRFLSTYIRYAQNLLDNQSHRQLIYTLPSINIQHYQATHSHHFHSPPSPLTPLSHRILTYSLHP